MENKEETNPIIDPSKSPINAISNIVNAPVLNSEEKKEEIIENKPEDKILIPSSEEKKQEETIKKPEEQEIPIESSLEKINPEIHIAKENPVLDNNPENEKPLEVKDLEAEKSLPKANEEGLLNLAETQRSGIQLSGNSPGKKEGFPDAGGSSPKSPQIGIKRSPRKKRVDERTG